MEKMKLSGKENGKKPYVVDIEEATVKNDTYGQLSGQAINYK
jgi:hypothetical protein